MVKNRLQRLELASSHAVAIKTALSVIFGRSTIAQWLRNRGQQGLRGCARLRSRGRAFGCDLISGLHLQGDRIEALVTSAVGADLQES